MSELAVSFKNVYFKYEEDVDTIEDISFDIPKGEYCCLIGHNGSGKSTIAKLINGLLAELSGDVVIFGTKMTDDNAYQLRKKIGIVFQNPDNQFISSTVRDDIAFGLENDLVSEDKMEEIVEKYATLVGMKDFLDKEPSNLSGGQKQRVAIAGVLARNPSILILDEATSMLDPKGKREILDLIHKTKESNKDLTIVSITHDIQEAYNSNHVIVLNDGKKVLDGKPKDVFNDAMKLKSLRLDVPFYMELDEELKKLGIDVKGASDLNSLVKELCQ